MTASRSARGAYCLSGNNSHAFSRSANVNSSVRPKPLNTRVNMSSRNAHPSSSRNIRRRAALLRRNQNSRFSGRLADRRRSPVTNTVGYNRPFSTHKSPLRHNSGSESKMSSWEREEMIRLMRKKDEEYRKKEEELKMQRERERMRFERERLEREKLEVQQLKLTAQLASAQMAFLPQSTHQSLPSVGVSDTNGPSGDRNRGNKSKHPNRGERGSR